MSLSLLDDSAVATDVGEEPGVSVEIAGFGPWDVEDVPEAVLRRDRHWLGAYVHTASARLHIPPGARVSEEKPEGVDEVQALHITVGAVHMVLSIHGAPKSEQLWADNHRGLIEAELCAAGADVSRQPSVEGWRVCAVMPGQEIVAAGVDGPRWMARVVAYASGSFAVADVHRLIDDLLADLVVVRGSAPVGPGWPLDMMVQRSLVRHVM